VSTERPLEAKVAIVTGAGRGLGRAACLALAQAGAAVVAGARSERELTEVADIINASGGRCLGVPTDVTAADSVAALVQTCVAAFGRVDIVVNNAGVARSAQIVDMGDDDWDVVMNTNVRGTFLLLREAGRLMTAQRSGKVVNIASHWAFKGVAGYTAYCASKAAVVNLTRAAATEWARYGVQVNALAPGYFETDINAEARADDGVHERILAGIPMRRMGRPEELGQWIVTLASSASDFMTGEVIVVDGGETAA